MVLDVLFGVWRFQKDNSIFDEDDSIGRSSVSGNKGHRDEFQGPHKSDCSVLFIVGDLGSGTPIRNAKGLMLDLRNIHLIVVENAAHAVRWNQAELGEAWSRFLAGETPTVTKVVAMPIQFSLPESIEPDVPEGTAELTAEELAACEGKCKLSNGLVSSIQAASNGLVEKIPGRGKFNLCPNLQISFVADNPNIPPPTFVLDAAGKAMQVEGGESASGLISYS